MQHRVHAATMRSSIVRPRASTAPLQYDATGLLQSTLGNQALQWALGGERGIEQSTASNAASTATKASGATRASATINAALESPGDALPAPVQVEMRQCFGFDFGNVQIHVGSTAEQAADALGAKAYTVGSHIVFGAGQYAPQAKAGVHLLAHELAHVVQQSRGGSEPGVMGENLLEGGAESAARAISTGQSAVEVSGASGVGIARDEDPLKRKPPGEDAPPATGFYMATDQGPMFVLGFGPATPAPRPAAPEAIEEVIVRGKRPPRPAPKRAQPTPAAPNVQPAPVPPSPTPPIPQPVPPAPVVVPAPAAAAPTPDWTTQVEWVFETTEHSPFAMVRSYDTGSAPLNFVVNKVLLPWRNLLAAVENTPFEMMGALDDAMRRTPFAMEWEAAQTMMPLGKSMGIAVEAPGALRYLGILLSSALRAETAVQEGVSATRAGQQVLQVGETGLLFPWLSNAPQAEAVAEEALQVARAGEEFVPIDESGLLVPRQLSIYDISPSLRGTGRTGPYYTKQWNALMKFLYNFEPKPGQSYSMNGILYTFDEEKQLVRVSTDKNMLGARWESVYKNVPRPSGHDYGHVGGISTFGTNDLLIQTYGGYPQAAAFNQSGAWRMAEGEVGNAVFGLEQLGKPWRKVAEVRNFVNGIPSEWRLFVESNGRIVYDSGWLKAPVR